MLSPLNSSPNFKALFFANKKFSKAQYRVAVRIQGELSKVNYSSPDKSTYLSEFEQNGINFKITPAKDDYSVILEKDTTDAENKNKLNIFKIFNKNFSRIGVYNYEHRFNIKDIKDAENGTSGNDAEWKLYALMATVAAMVAVPIINKFNEKKDFIDIQKNIEKIDSLKQIQDTIPKNTAKLLK